MIPPTKPERRLTLNSRLLPWLVGLLAVMQVVAPYRGWVILLVGLGGLWLFCLGWAWMLAQSLWVEREMRFGWAQVGDRLEERFTLTNAGPLPALWVEIIDHSTMPGYNPSRATGIGGTSTSRWYSRGECRQRGIYTLGPTTVRSGDPFGLFTVAITNPDSATFTVLPPIVSLPFIEVAAGGRAGEGRSRPDPFERTVSASGVRPYLPGDSRASIHWPTSARRSGLFVRTFDSMPSGDWWLVLDLDAAVQAGQDMDSTAEHAVILAASLADRGLRLNRAVGLLAYGQELVWLPPRNDPSQRERILRHLAVITPGNRSLSDLLSRAVISTRQAVSLVIITPAVDGSWIPALLPLLHRGAQATVLLLDPQSFGGPASARPCQSTLTSLGVTVHRVTRDLLNRPDTRPGQRGRWDWRVTPTGRARPGRQPGRLTWRRLGN